MADFIPFALDPSGQDSRTRVLAVVGPTAVGKSDVAEGLATLEDGEIVSADSMQVYRGMNVGTAKTPIELRRVPHHCVDVVEPGAAYSAALFQACARDAIAEISTRGRMPVVVGGTGLYVRAAIDDWHFPTGDQVGGPMRGRLDALAGDLGPEGLHLYLKQRDPAAAALIHPNNVRRVIRALEMAESGVSYAQQAEGFGERRSIYDVCLLGLTMDRAALYSRIDQRVDRMVEAGLVSEVRRLLDAGLRDALTAQHAIGYKELVPVIEDGFPLDDATQQIKRATRRYAKRQLTWFRADPRIHWIDVTDLSLSEAIDSAHAAIHWH